MTITALHIAGYRSFRSLRLRPGQLEVFVGANGSGKSNLYRSLMLLSAAARGEFARLPADEGGMPSVLWAGTRQKERVRMTLSVVCDPWEFEISSGLPILGSPFPLDPVIKEERVRYVRGGARPVALLERKNATAWLRDSAGKRREYPVALLPSESVLAQIREANLYPELTQLREEMSSWRFYHHFRTDPDSPLRRPQVGVLTRTLNADGSDLAAALASTMELGDRETLRQEIDAAFPGAGIEIIKERGRFEVAMRTPGIQRPFEARELSDGTLRYLCLLAIFFGLRPPGFVVLNEPETSIHEGLLEPLARMIVRAAERTQIWIITHSELLATHIGDASGRAPLRLRKVHGESQIEGLSILGERNSDEEELQTD